jgi:hypothetical protein
MEQVTPVPWPFDVPRDTIVVTSTYVTKDLMPILYVTHEEDEEEGIIWQFHCGNGDYDPAVLKLVRLDEILSFDGDLVRVAELPLGFRAVRSSKAAAWVFERERT